MIGLHFGMNVIRNVAFHLVFIIRQNGKFYHFWGALFKSLDPDAIGMGF